MPNLLHRPIISLAKFLKQFEIGHLDAKRSTRGKVDPRGMQDGFRSKVQSSRRIPNQPNPTQQSTSVHRSTPPTPPKTKGNETKTGPTHTIFLKLLNGVPVPSFPINALPTNAPTPPPYPATLPSISPSASPFLPLKLLAADEPPEFMADKVSPGRFRARPSEEVDVLEDGRGRGTRGRAGRGCEETEGGEGEGELELELVLELDGLCWAEEAEMLELAEAEEEDLEANCQKTRERVRIAPPQISTFLLLLRPAKPTPRGPQENNPRPNKSVTHSSHLGLQTRRDLHSPRLLLASQSAPYARSHADSRSLPIQPSTTPRGWTRDSRRSRKEGRGSQLIRHRYSPSTTSDVARRTDGRRRRGSRRRGGGGGGRSVEIEGLRRRDECVERPRGRRGPLQRFEGCTRYHLFGWWGELRRREGTEGGWRMLSVSGGRRSLESDEKAQGWI